MVKLRIVQVNSTFRVQRKILGLWITYSTFFVPNQFDSIEEAEDFICEVFNRKSINDPTPRLVRSVVKEIQI